MTRTRTARTSRFLSPTGKSYQEILRQCLKRDILIGKSKLMINDDENCHIILFSKEISVFSPLGIEDVFHVPKSLMNSA